MRDLPLLLLIATAAAALLTGTQARGQNVVDVTAAEKTLDPVALSPDALDLLMAETPDLAARADGPEAARVRAKLDAHVAEFIAGWPWAAFHNTLGISGYEAYFNHPDEVFYALALALPQLAPETAAAVRAFLKSQLAETPPYAEAGYENRSGAPREAYNVPDGLRRDGRGKANGALGVYAMWAYVRWSGDSGAARAHWDATRARMAPVLEKPYAFDIHNLKYVQDEAERLTADLAGLVGLVRLAHLNGDAATEAAARAKALELLALRVNLDRANPCILEPTRAASKSLHISKLARYGDLVPEVGRAVDRLSDGAARTRVRAFREARNGWHMAFAERLIGGENWVSPPHMGRAVMAGSVLVDDVPGDRLLEFVDVPWCKGDLYFIEKCGLALWGAAGRPWTKAQ